MKQNPMNMNIYIYSENLTLRRIIVSHISGYFPSTMMQSIYRALIGATARG